MRAFARILIVGCAFTVAMSVMQAVYGKDLLAAFVVYWGLLSLGYVISFVSTPKSQRGSDDFRNPGKAAVGIVVVLLLGSIVMIGSRNLASISQ